MAEMCGSRISFAIFAVKLPRPTRVIFARNLTPKMDVQIIKPTILEAFLIVAHDPGILEGRELHDIRSTFGLVFYLVEFIGNASLFRRSSGK